MIMTIPTLHQTVDRIVALSRRDFKGVEALGLKLMEEVGEFAETVNFHQGYLPHKVMKEPVIGEAADVIQNVIAMLAKVYDDMTGPEIAAMLEQYLDSKTDKWESILVEAKAPKTAQEIMNEMFLEGHIDAAYAKLLSSQGQIGGGDEAHIYLGRLVRKAVDKALGQEVSEEQEHAKMVEALGKIFGWNKETT